MPRSAACPGPGLTTPSPGLTLEQFTEIVLAQERLEEDRAEAGAGDRRQAAVITHRQVSRAARYSIDMCVQICVDIRYRQS